MTIPKRDQNARLGGGGGGGGKGVWCSYCSLQIFYSSEDLTVISMGDEFLVMIGKVCHHILFSFEQKHPAKTLPCLAKFHYEKYSRTSMARTLMARLPRLFRTRS